MRPRNKTSVRSSKHDVQKVRSCCKEFLDDRKNANSLVDVAALSEVEDNDVLLACIQAFHKIYHTLVSNQEMCLERMPKPEYMNDLTKEEKLKLWYKDRYDEARVKLLEFLQHENENIQELALCTLMKLVKAEGQYPLLKIQEKNVWFPTTFFQQIMQALLSPEKDMTSLNARFQEFLEYDDVRYHTMKCLNSTLKDKKLQEEEDKTILLSNVFSILENLTLPASAPAENDRLAHFMSHVPDTSGLKVNTLKEHKKAFSTLWLDFLKLQLPVSLYKKVLVILHDKVIPNMTNPRLLADFLTASYDIGGAISLLALNGVFILVNQYNLDYPEFYEKLYALFEPSVFHVKYRARFFFLADLFLSSTHIPAYLVAAFIKRLSRLALTAPPSGITVLLPFIYNLIRRHPNCEVLVNQENPPSDITSDPFLMDEKDPVKCEAMKSSLWEIKTLQSHYHHSVSKEAKAVDKPLGFNETDISDLLETDIQDLIGKERGKKQKAIHNVACTFTPPSGLFGNQEDQLQQFWSWRDLPC